MRYKQRKKKQPELDSDRPCVGVINFPHHSTSHVIEYKIFSFFFGQLKKQIRHVELAERGELSIIVTGMTCSQVMSLWRNESIFFINIKIWIELTNGFQFLLTNYFNAFVIKEKVRQWCSELCLSIHCIEKLRSSKSDMLMWFKIFRLVQQAMILYIRKSSSLLIISLFYSLSCKGIVYRFQTLVTWVFSIVPFRLSPCKNFITIAKFHPHDWRSQKGKLKTQFPFKDKHRWLILILRTSVSIFLF